ncbi:hypothetical protein E4U31_008083 [Claviceps sp. LM219 group G6]|nr:hypothetical protein E4U31_008083 [Claviceps sp. LM219 group G6]
MDWLLLLVVDERVVPAEGGGMKPTAAKDVFEWRAEARDKVRRSAVGKTAHCCRDRRTRQSHRQDRLTDIPPRRLEELGKLLSPAKAHRDEGKRVGGQKVGLQEASV